MGEVNFVYGRIEESGGDIVYNFSDEKVFEKDLVLYREIIRLRKTYEKMYMMYHMQNIEMLKLEEVIRTDLGSYNQKRFFLNLQFLKTLDIIYANFERLSKIYSKEIKNGKSKCNSFYKNASEKNDDFLFVKEIRNHLLHNTLIFDEINLQDKMLFEFSLKEVYNSCKYKDRHENKKLKTMSDKNVRINQIELFDSTKNYNSEVKKMMFEIHKELSKNCTGVFEEYEKNRYFPHYDFYGNSGLPEEVESINILESISGTTELTHLKEDLEILLSYFNHFNDLNAKPTTTSTSKGGVQP